MKFRKMPYFSSEELWATTEVIFGRMNNEMTNTVMSHIHSYEELEEEVGEEFTKEKNFTSGMTKS